MHKKNLGLIQELQQRAFPKYYQNYCQTSNFNSKYSSDGVKIVSFWLQLELNTELSSVLS